MVRKVIKNITHMRDLWFPYIQNIALATGIMPGSKDYIRFIILGRSRSGSNFLRGLLNSHHQVVVYGEIFQNPAYIGWALQGFSQSKRLMSMYLEKPVEFISQKVYKKFPLGIKAVGFKIFYYHAQGEKAKDVWDYLVGDKEIRVLHMKRKNILRTHLSRKKALYYDSWVNTSGEIMAFPPLTLSYEECLADFVQTRAWEEHYDLLFQDHHKIDLIYEEFSENYQDRMYAIQSFLRVDYKGVQPQTYKQSEDSLSYAIENYFELKSQFIGTQWEEFFED